MGYRKYEEQEQILKLEYYKNLPEKNRRHFLAIEYECLGIGSQRYLASIFGCCRKTLIKGCKELRASAGGAIDYGRQRKAGGGAKKKKT